jgi:hypothetical protein
MSVHFSAVRAISTAKRNLCRRHIRLLPSLASSEGKSFHPPIIFVGV